MKILIVEDSSRLRETLKDGLTKLGYGVDTVGDGIEGLEYAKCVEYDVIILDLMLPGLSGLTVLKELRAFGRKTHVLILSAKDQVEDRVRGLQSGADDYMIKPFSFDELCARINALARRKYDHKNPEVRLGTLRVNIAVREVRQGHTPIHLTPSEYAILECLLFNRGRVVTLERLVEVVYDSDHCPGPNIIPVMVCNLRKKLAPQSEEEVIKTRRGYGYYIAQENL